MHKLKEQAVMMKEALLKGELGKIGEILDFGWQFKKNMATGITNQFIDDIYKTAMLHGSTGGKISGAGGGGFMFFYCPGTSRSGVIEALKKFGGQGIIYLDPLISGEIAKSEKRNYYQLILHSAFLHFLNYRLYL
jgi:D-glycero-alpha-D-manno-heptose-7-phosphate kinase